MKVNSTRVYIRTQDLTACEIWNFRMPTDNFRAGVAVWDCIRPRLTCSCVLTCLFHWFAHNSIMFCHWNFVIVLFYFSSQLLPFKSIDVGWKPFVFFIVPLPSLVHWDRDFSLYISTLFVSVNVKRTYTLFVAVFQVTSSILEWKIASPLHETGMKFQTRMTFHSGMRTGMNSTRDEFDLIQDSCKQLKGF